MKLKNLLVLCNIIFLDSLGNFLSLPILFRITHQYSYAFFNHISIRTQNTMFGLSLFVTPLLGIILSPVLGRLSDKVGRKSVIFFTLCLSVISYFLAILGVRQKSFLIILLAKSFLGVSSASQPIAEASITDLTADNIKRSYYIGLITCSMVMAMVIGMPLGAFLSDTSISLLFTLYTPFIIGISLSLICIVLIVYIYKETHVRKQLVQAGTVYIKNKPLKKLFPYFLIFFSLQFSWAIFYQYIPIFLKTYHHFSINRASIFLSFISFIMGVALLVLYYFISKLISLSYIVLLCCLIAFISLSFFLFTKLLYFWGSIFSIAIGLYYPALVTIMTKKISPEKYGWLMGCNTALMNTAWLTSSLLITLFSMIYGLLNILSAVFFIVLAFILVLRYVVI